MRSPQPSLALMTSFSDTSLEGFELARLDEIAQLRREVQEIHEEWVEAEVAARLARLLLEGRRPQTSTGAESLALPDLRIAARNLPAPPPALRGIHAKTGSASVLDRQCRKQHAAHAFAAGESTTNLAFESATALGPAANQAATSARASADDSRPAVAARPAISQQSGTSRGEAVRNRRRPAPAAAKSRSTGLHRPCLSSQLHLFAEPQQNPQCSEPARIQPEDHRPNRALQSLIRRPRVLTCHTLAFCDFRAAS
jgi:hypothetical protein